MKNKIILGTLLALNCNVTMAMQTKHVQKNNVQRTKNIEEKYTNNFTTLELRVIQIFTEYALKVMNLNKENINSELKNLDAIRDTLYKTFRKLPYALNVKSACLEIGIDIDTLFDFYDNVLPQAKNYIPYWIKFRLLSADKVETSTIIRLLISGKQNQDLLIKFLQLAKESVSILKGYGAPAAIVIDTSELTQFVLNFGNKEENESAYKFINYKIQNNNKKGVSDYLMENPLRIIMHLSHAISQDGPFSFSEYISRLSKYEDLVNSTLSILKNNFLEEQQHVIDFINKLEEEIEIWKKSTEIIEKHHNIITSILDY